MIHHLNCATMRPLAGPAMVAHVLLVERADGLLLVDTGLGRADLDDPRRLGPVFRRVIGPALDPAETAVRQIEALGFSAGDVTDIVLTHLDLDHAGGVTDFPRARVHVHADELAAARRPTWRERERYVAAQWRDADLVSHLPDGESWQGFDAVRVVGDDVLLVPLAGHSRGHSGVAVRRLDGDWLLHAGDAYFHAAEMAQPPSCPAPLRLFQHVVALDDRQRLANAERLRELVATRPAGVTVFSAHDAGELAALQAAPTG